MPASRAKLMRPAVGLYSTAQSEVKVARYFEARIANRERGLPALATM